MHLVYFEVEWETKGFALGSHERIKRDEKTGKA